MYINKSLIHINYFKGLSVQQRNFFGNIVQHCLAYPLCPVNLPSLRLKFSVSLLQTLHKNFKGVLKGSNNYAPVHQIKRSDFKVMADKVRQIVHTDIGNKRELSEYGKNYRTIKIPYNFIGKEPSSFIEKDKSKGQQGCYRQFASLFEGS